MKMKKLIAAAMSAILSISALGMNVGATITRIGMFDKADKENFTAATMKAYEKLVSDETSKRYIRNIDPDWTDAQKVAYLYTNLVNQGRHYEGSETTGILYCGQGICNIFAEEFSVVCDILGIRSRTASPAIKGVSHEFNLVEIDGKWYELDCDGGHEFLTGTNNTRNLGTYNTAGTDGIFPTVEAYSPYNEYKLNSGSVVYTGASNAHYFEYNGQWFRYTNSYIDKINSSLYCDSADHLFKLFGNAPASELEARNSSQLKAEESWEPGCFAYDNNGHLYFDWKDSIYVYNAATNTSSKVFTLSKTIKGSDINKRRNGYGSQPSTHAPFQWFGIDKYALYYVCLDGSYGSIPLGSDKTHLELTSDSKVIGVGEYAFVAPMASTEFRCGKQVTFSTKDTDVIELDTKYGVFKGLKAGKATVTISAYGRSNTYTVTVKDGSTTENVIGEAFYLNKGSKVDLSYLFSFDTKGKVKYTSSNKSIVKIATSSGKSVIKGIKTGEAVITASCGNEKKILKVCVINSAKETTSISLSSAFERNYLYGKGEAMNCTQSTESVILTASLNKSSTDIVNWVGSDGKYVGTYSHGLDIVHNQSLFFTWTGVGSAGERTLYCIASNGKVKSYKFDVKVFIENGVMNDGTTWSKNYNTDKLTTSLDKDNHSETSYTKKDIENSFFFDTLKTGETAKDSLEDFLADYASEALGSKSHYKNAQFYSLDTSIVKIVEKNGKHYVKCVNAEKGGYGGDYIIVVCNGKVEGLMFMFK